MSWRACVCRGRKCSFSGKGRGGRDKWKIKKYCAGEKPHDKRTEGGREEGIVGEEVNMSNSRVMQCQGEPGTGCWLAAEERL